MTKLDEAITALKDFIESEGFRGYDPYDVLNSRLKISRVGKWAPVLATQLHKRNPLNLRGALGIEKEYNPKAMGLLLQAYCLSYQKHPNEKDKESVEFLFHWLVDNSSHGYSGYCWGYNFDWASPQKYVAAHTPSVVVTAFVAKGIFEYFTMTNDPKAWEVLEGCGRFILDDLPRTEAHTGICFSYTPLQPDCCYNASLLGAETLSRLYSVAGEPGYLDFAKPAVDFVIDRQHEDGRWNYSIDLETGMEREQVDFHQGYILDSLSDFVSYSGSEDSRYREAISRGAEFYKREQFFEDGRAKWRLPRVWPVDIHCLAQGIISFVKLSEFDESFLGFAESIAHWTLENMRDKRGYFYYQKHRFLTNKIPYMRWAQAWMLLALTRLSFESSL
jgi:hypothetical protein